MGIDCHKRELLNKAWDIIGQIDQVQRVLLSDWIEKYRGTESL